MFDLRTFLRKGFIEAIGRKPDYQIRLEASDWMKSGVLTETDLAEINEKIEEQYPVISVDTDNTEIM